MNQCASRAQSTAAPTVAYVTAVIKVAELQLVLFTNIFLLATKSMIKVMVFPR